MSYTHTAVLGGSLETTYFVDGNDKVYRDSNHDEGSVDVISITVANAESATQVLIHFVGDRLEESFSSSTCTAPSVTQVAGGIDCTFGIPSGAGECEWVSSGTGNIDVTVKVGRET